MSFSRELTGLTDNIIAVPHVFTGRAGGASRGVYESFNLGVSRGDDENAVRENYRRLARFLGTDAAPVFGRQAHGGTVRRVCRDDAGDIFAPAAFEADGLVTDDSAVLLVIFVADCIPILLWDPENNAVGAVHAGWRGTTANIAGRAVSVMRDEFGSSPENIRAAIGPGIGSCCFETDGDVPAAVMGVLPERGGEFIIPQAKPGKYKVSLKGVNRELLINAGLLSENIDVCPDCTMCMSGSYWSHRRDGAARGSQCAAITLGSGL